jgi:hypothetical protein
MSDLASEAAEAFLHKYEIRDKHIASSPETFLEYSISYLTVRTLHRHEKALKSLETDSRWIKWSAIITLFLTAVLACLTVVLAIYAQRLDVAINEARQSTESVAPTPSPSP